MDRPLQLPPDREGTHRGLAYALWLPTRVEHRPPARDPRRLPDPPWPGVVIHHGAGSCKENHADFARLAAASGWAALAFDARGHGASGGELSPEAVADLVAMVELLRASGGIDPERVAVRGSSLGGFIAIHAASRAPEIAGLIAVCPAGEAQLRRGLRSGELEVRADVDALDTWLGEHDLREAVDLSSAEGAGRPLILLHAEGDERIPSEWSAELYERAAEPKRLILVPGGDHRSVQHDPELQAVALDWLHKRLDEAWD